MRARRFAIALGLGWAAAASAAFAAETAGLPFAGRWLRDAQPGAQPRYPVLVVDAGRMTWRGADKSVPDCVQPFVLHPEKPGTVYTDGRGRKFVAGAKGSFPTYLLDVGASSCGGAGAQARISYPLPYDAQNIEFIDYVGGKPVGVRRFHRAK